jgi:hypothetical protein
VRSDARVPTKRRGYLGELYHRQRLTAPQRYVVHAGFDARCYRCAPVGRRGLVGTARAGSGDDARHPDGEGDQNGHCADRDNTKDNSRRPAYSALPVTNPTLLSSFTGFIPKLAF